MSFLGKFHAVSIAIKDQQPEKFKEIVKNLEEIIFVPDSPMSLFVNPAEKMAVECITEEHDADLLQAVLRLYERNQYDQLVELTKSEEAEPYAVVLHGDLWTNNTMFNYDDSMDVRFLDFQVTRYGSPGMVSSAFLSSTRADLL